jgi:hypothetical protein
MTSDSTSLSRKRGLFQGLRNNISSRPTSLKEKPLVLSGSRSSLSHEGLKSVLVAEASLYTGTTTSSAQGRVPISTLYGEILENALRLLEEPERGAIEEYLLSNDVSSALQRAFEAAQAKRQECESKRWVFAVGGHTLKLQDEADKVILWLDRFKQVGDIAVNADPIHASLPWAEIRLLLEVCSHMLTPSTSRIT